MLLSNLEEMPIFKLNEVVVYRKDIYQVNKKERVNNEEYYILTPIDNATTLVKVPASNKMGYLRKLSTKQEIDELVKRIPSIPLIDGNNRTIENDYKRIMKTADLDDLVSIVKTTYYRNNDRLVNNKKLSSVDNTYFTQAEDYLIKEISCVFDVESEKVKKYLRDKFLKSAIS